MRQMHANLVCAPGFENETDKRDVSAGFFSREHLNHFVVRLGTATGLAARDGDFHAVRAAAPEARIDGAGGPRQPSPNEGKIAAVEAAVATVALELLRQSLMRRIGLGDHEQARRVLVQPMDNSRPLDAADAREAISAVGDQGVYEGARRVSRRRVNDETRRLVDHDQIVVFIDGVERKIFALDAGYFRFRQTDRVSHAGFDRCPRLPYRRTGANVAIADERLDAGAAHAIDLRGKPTIDALARIFGTCDNLDAACYFFVDGHGARNYQKEIFVMTNDPPQSPTADLMREQRLQRNLKIVVGGLALLILLGLGAVAIKIMGLALVGAPSTPSSRTVSVTPGSTLSLEIPKGSRIVSVSLSGGRLAVQHEGPGGPGIAIIDIDTGKRVADVKLMEALPHN